MDKNGKRCPPTFQFQVVLEVLKGDRDPVEIARAHDLHLVPVARWKREFLKNGPAVFAKDTALAGYEKKIKEIAAFLPERRRAESATHDQPVSKHRLRDPGEGVAWRPAPGGGGPGCLCVSQRA